MILLWAFLLNMALGALTTVSLYLSYPAVREQFGMLEGQSFLCKFIVLTRAFMLNHWELLFDFLTSITYDPYDDEGDDDDGDINTATQGS